MLFTLIFVALVFFMTFVVLPLAVLIMRPGVFFFPGLCIMAVMLKSLTGSGKTQTHGQFLVDAVTTAWLFCWSVRWSDARERSPQA